MLTLEEIREWLARLAELTDEELTQLDESIEAVAAELLDQDDDAADTDEAIQLLTEVADAKDAVATEKTGREEKAAERKAAADALRQRIRGDAEGDEGDEGEGDEETPPPADPAAPAEEKAKEPVAATAKPSPATARRPVTTRPRQADAQHAALTLVASANLPGVNMGTPLTDRDVLAKAIMDTWRAGIGYQGGRHNVPIASLSYDFPEDRTLDDNPDSNARKIDAVTSPQAITAAGGICAPAPIQYDLPVIGSTARPIRDGLPSFGVARGAVRTITPPTIDNVAGNTQAGTNVAIWTEANDQSPSAPATKPCLTITCGADTTTAVDAITQCIQTGNFRDRYFQESVQAWLTLNDVWAARVKEQNLLAKIAAGSVTYTAGTVLGTARDMIAAIQRHIATIQYWWRLDDSIRFRLLLPRWLQENIAVDLAREQPGATAERLLTDDSFVNQIFSNMGCNVTWLMEGESSQRFVRPNAGQIEPWPSHVFAYIFLEGAWLYLNGGTLNLGVVRDSTLNATNNFQMFQEEFEQAHFHGTFSHKLDIDICPSGATSLPIAVSVCTSGS
jgi:hypothetical protein